MRRKRLIFGILAITALLVMSNLCEATSYLVGGREMNINGYLSQSLAFSLKDDHYDTA